MTLPPVFPAAKERGLDPFQAIALSLKCEEHQVWSAFWRVELPEWTTPRHFNALRQRTIALNEAARIARSLHHTLRRLPTDLIDDSYQPPRTLTHAGDSQGAGSLNLWCEP